MTTHTIEQIPMSQIILSELNVRKDLDAGCEDAGIEDLAKSINEKGLINPIVVLDRNGNYELIAGKRRYIACQLLGWETIPALIRYDLKDIDARIPLLIP